MRIDARPDGTITTNSRQIEIDHVSSRFALSFTSSSIFQWHHDARLAARKYPREHAVRRRRTPYGPAGDPYIMQMERGETCQRIIRRPMSGLGQNHFSL